MKLADGIRKHGFRKWYERELLQSHAHLVLTFCCMIGLFAVFEGLSRRRDWAEQAQDLATLVLCAVVGVWALRRYLYFLNHAEAAALQADCPQCRAYGRFSVVEDDAAAHTLQVCCRKCGQHWTISD
ncbi:MAG TPA: MJ0042-type zinc finger domain-containing protein [Burkholderiaceae bacterium]|nr:MJ0042-type zinc finger domain-containing protein [Burkholderiaceae bacterium]